MVNTDLNVPFTLKIKQTTAIDTQNLKITFLNITEDSRCPSDVQCVWEDQAKVQINVLQDNNNIMTFNLTKRAGHDELSVLNIGRYAITLKNVETYHVSTKKIENRDYSIVLKVKKV